MDNAENSVTSFSVTEFSALSVDPRDGISQSASETNVYLFFLPVASQLTENVTTTLAFGL